MDQAYNHPVECHETWVYSDTEDKDTTFVGTQTLDSINALCPMCHLSKHMGFAESIGKSNEAAKHYAKVNGLSFKEADADIQLAFEEWRERSKYKWKLNCAKIEKEYGIKINHGKHNNVRTSKRVS